MTRNCAFSPPDSPEIAKIFCKQTRIGIIPTRKADPNIFLLALKRDCMDARYVKLPYSIHVTFLVQSALLGWLGG